MKFKMIHNNLNVANLKTSMDFYGKALGLKEVRRIDGDGFTIVYLGDGTTGGHLLELTEVSAHPQKYDLGENEIHLAFETDDYAGAYRLHQAMNCICYENPEMSLYFITDPDGYWLEILSKRV